MPSPQFVLKGRTTDSGVNDVRNVSSPHWRRWLDPDNCCLVPYISFSEYETDTDGKKVPVWFALDHSRPLAAFAGIWTNWTSVRKVKEARSPPTYSLSSRPPQTPRWRLRSIVAILLR